MWPLPVLLLKANIGAGSLKHGAWFEELKAEGSEGCLGPVAPAEPAVQPVERRGCPASEDAKRR